MAIVCNIRKYRQYELRGGWDPKSTLGLVGILLLAGVCVLFFPAMIFFSPEEVAAGGERVPTARQSVAPSPRPSAPATQRLPSQTEKLIAALDADNPSARFVAIGALKAKGTNAKEAIPALARSLKDKDPLVRSAAAEALGATRPYGKDIHAQIGALLEDEYHYCRLAATAALWEIGIPTEETATVIWDALQLEMPSQVRTDAARCISSETDEASLYVVDVIMQPESYSKEEAVSHILSIKDGRLADVIALVRILKAEVKP